MDYVALKHNSLSVFHSVIPSLRPTAFDPSHHHYNSDRSQLVITSVARADLGEYVCTATNQIAESRDTIMLHVYGQLLLHRQLVELVEFWDMICLVKF